MDEEAHRALMKDPGVELVIDLETQSMKLPSGKEVRFPIDAFARLCLLQGQDELDFLLDQEAEIAAFEKLTG